jgi:proline iminopeptidase
MMRTCWCLKFYLLFITMLLAISLQAQAVHEGAVLRGDFTLHYKTVGQGAPLLLLSGGPGFDVDYMMPVAQELSRWYQCILLEQRGTGRSQPKTLTPETLNLKLMVDDIEAVRTQLKSDRFTLLGHSWGGMLAMAYTARYPDHVKSLILVSSGGMDSSFGNVFLDNITVRASANDRQRIQAAQAALARASDVQAAYLDFFRLVVPLYFFDRQGGEEFIAAGTKESFHPQMAQLLERDYRNHYHVRNQLGSFLGPALIIQGHQDPIPEGTALQTNAVLKNSELVFLDQCGHFPWLEQPKAFYAKIQGFLKVGTIAPQ